MQQHTSQNPIPLPLYTPSNHLYTTHYPSHYQPPNPNPSPSIDPRQPHYTAGPAVYPYASVSSLPQIHGGGGVGYEAYQTHVAYPHHQTSAVPSGYYQDPNWSANGVIPHYGSTRYATGIPIPPNGPVQLVPANANSTSRPNPQPRGNNKTWKRVPHKTKVVQSVWCAVCKVECDTKDVLDKHKSGKKHKKNMDKLKEATAPPPVASDNPVIGPQENPAGKGKGRRKADVSVEDFEAKRRKVLEGGAAADAVRTCAICKVVCNSEVVFKYHIEGQKHLAMMKRHALGL
ncbi:hypothetical protein RHSIM_Rhsim08G0074200 [Rhododendron simsii]|uniref:U1-type domain-containing protein n=1 Tax=Rhododendron simsii TaxID=118357 RepID=A0A834GN09_RHOSS|nr:hypothetical protein RHSIM_Rhsim08G0074200 [Rhododendron simsii]